MVKSKTLHGQYFLQISEILPHTRRLLKEFHNKFSFMFLSGFILEIEGSGV